MSEINVAVAHQNAAASQSTRSWGRILVLVLTWTWLWDPTVQSADFWVGPKGRNAPTQGTRDRPWASLQYAADRVRTGDTIHVLDGDYTGFDLRHGGTRAASVGFKAEGKRVRIVRPNRKTPDGINVEGADHVVIDGFIVDGMPRGCAWCVRFAPNGPRNPRYPQRILGIFTAHFDDVAIVGNQVSDSVKEHGIYVSNSGDRPVIRRNLLWGNRGCGIHMNGDSSQGGDGIISHALVENNIVCENGKSGGSGINCDGVRDSIFQNNLLFNNHSSGISLYRIDGAGGSTGNFVINNTIIQAANARWAINITDQSIRNQIANNILLHKGSKGSINISADSLTGLRSDYNIVVDRFSPDDGGRFVTLADWRSATGLDRHSRVSKPEDLFVEQGSNDYHLSDKSPAIDAADPSTAPRIDLDGKARPIGVRPDIGAYEH